MNCNFVKGSFTESELEKAIIEVFENQGYPYINGDNIIRDKKEILLLDDLKEYINNRYKDENLTENEVQQIINKIDLIDSAPLYEGNKKAFFLVNEGFNLIRDDSSKLALHINYINFDEPEKNIFKIVNQYTVVDVKERRPDLLLFINGIPVVIFEFKSTIREETTIYDAWKQIKVRYNRDIPNLMKYCFLSVISDGVNSKMGSIFTPYPFYYSWNKINDKETVAKGIKSLITMLKGAFSKERVVSILRDFIFYPDNSKKEKAIVCRYPQYFGANRMFKNIRKHLKPLGDGRGGTYFGATGCGKTYTMLFLSRLLSLRDNEKLKNPTIIIIVDREDLNNQSSELFVNAKRFLHEENVRSIEDRADLERTLKDKPSGGVYVTTIQKFCETTGLLSKRENIICISDEAHRTQTGTGSKLKKDETGVYISHGFAYYLRESFPNATYCGFTGTPIDDTITVFGDVVDKYTMKESSDDGITVKMRYEARLARVILSDKQAKEIEEYYKECAEEGSTLEQIEKSKRAMSSMKSILGHPDRLKKLAFDIANHYEKLCMEKPNVVQKAMIVCSERNLAFKLLQEILKIRPSWGEEKKSENDNKLKKEELEQLIALPKINLVATRSKDDEKDLYDTCGTKEYRKMLDKQFKNNNSNFKIAIVVDMWITGFDVPSLAVMYIDKPLKKHTLIQTISRVNRVFDGKDKGLVVDYIGIKQDMFEAVKKFGDIEDSPIKDLKATLGIFRNYLALLDELTNKFNKNKFIEGTPLEKLKCLNLGAEYIQINKETQIRFMDLAKKLKNAYTICSPSGEITDEEAIKAEFYLAIRSIINKQTVGHAPDAEIMNEKVEKMIVDALACTGVENIIEENHSMELFSEEFSEELKTIKLPITKFNALVKLLKSSIGSYGKTNKIKSIEFDERLRKVLDKYNNRDDLVFSSEEMSDFVDELSEEVLNIMKDLGKDKESFKDLGITYEEKAFYDILIKVRDIHDFDYSDEKCVVLAKEINKLIQDKTKFADWSNRDDIKNQLKMELTVLLYDNGYPPAWNVEVFEQVMQQTENFKKNNS